MRAPTDMDAIKRWLALAPEPIVRELARRALELRAGVHAIKREPGDGSREAYSTYWCAVNMADALAAMSPRNLAVTREALARFFCAWNLYGHIWRRRAA